MATRSHLAQGGEERCLQSRHSSTSRCLEELRSCDRNALAFAAFEKREKSFGEVIDINCFSTYEKLIKSTAYVLLFLGNLKRRVVEHCAGTGRRVL